MTSAILVIAFAFGTRSGVLSVTPFASLAECESARVAIVELGKREAEEWFSDLGNLDQARVECLDLRRTTP